MTPEQIQSAIHGYVSDAVTYLESELSPARAVATEYYLGKKFGNEEAGRSQVILTDVRDTVLAMLPSLLRMYVPTSGRVFEYTARPKDLQHITQAVDAALQATEFINGVVLEQDNNGYLELSGAFKDALVRKLGTLKYWWEDSSTYKDYTAANCDVLQYETLVQDPDVEVTKVSEHRDEVLGVTYRDVEYRHWRKEGYARFTCCPPEEILLSRDARTREDAAFIGHRTEKTASELRDMGVSQQDIDDWGGPSTEVAQSIEEIARRGGISRVDKAPEPSQVKNLWIESYPYLDIDGDGIAELVKVRTLGPGCHPIGDPEPVDERPFAFFCPDPEPHVLIGGSVADRVMDLQLMRSSVLRAAADGLADSIFPRTFYSEDAIRRAAMESTAIGQNIPVEGGVLPGQAVFVQAKEWKGREALDMLAYLDTIKTQRIGPLPATLDPDALQSTPEIGVKATVQAASEQLELIARNFTIGMKQLGKGLLKLLVEHQPRARITRLRDQYIAVDPRAWDAEMDVAVHVALGTQEKLGVLAANTSKQELVLQTLGPTNPALSIGQLVHSYRTMLEIAGVADVGKFWNPVPLDYQPPPTPAQPDPNLLLAQAEMQKAQTNLAKAQAEFQIEKTKAAQQMADLQAQLASKAAELALKRHEIETVDARERDKAEAEIAVQVAEINAKYGTQTRVAEGEAVLERERMATDVALAHLKTAPKPGNGTPPPAPVNKKKGPKVTTVAHDAQGRITKLTTQEPD